MRVFIILTMLPMILAAQDLNHILHSGEYYYGTAEAFDYNQARDRALEDLTQQIAVRVQSEFVQRLEESGGSIKEDVQDILKTHSAATLKNMTIKQKRMDSGEFKVFCYIKRSELAKVYEQRKQLIAQMARKAKVHEQNGNMADALKLNYFALLLVNSIPDEHVSYQDTNYTLLLPERLSRILNGLEFNVKQDRKLSGDEREITLSMTADGQPVSKLDFEFWDGANMVHVSGQDGLATFRLFGSATAMQSLDLEPQYAYYDAREEYNVVSELWKVLKKPRFTVKKRVRLGEAAQVEPVVQQNGNWNISANYQDVASAERIVRETTRCLDLLKAHDTNGIRSAYSDDPFLRDKLCRYVRHNHPQPLNEEMQVNIAPTPMGYELRKIRVLHQYPSIHKQSNEYLVLDFSREGELIDMNMSVSKNMYDSFRQQSQYGKDWKYRQTIVKFVEKYRTAYLTRDIETVDLMFAEDALIIVGRKIQRRKMPENAVRYTQFGEQPGYEYLKLSKEQYINRQRRIFQSQQDLFLNFSTFDISKKNNAQGVYGVEMRQSYQSTTYADEGYLFLLVDLSQNDPLIYVRAWQPNEWDEDDLVDASNFRVYK